jgi:hypothetical protein
MLSKTVWSQIRSSDDVRRTTALTLTSGLSRITSSCLTGANIRFPNSCERRAMASCAIMLIGSGAAPLGVVSGLPPTNQLESFMRHLMIATAVGGSALLAAVPVSAQTQPAASPPSAPPPFATTKVEGTDNVYIFRYQGHQSMFVVTPDGVIATDPIGLGRPQAVTTYIDEIKKVTSQAGSRTRCACASCCPTKHRSVDDIASRPHAGLARGDQTAWLGW